MAKTRNKKYRPKPVHMAGGLVALAHVGARGEAAACLRPDQQTDLGAAYWLSIDNLACGSADEEHWSCVVCATNIGMALSETVLGAEYEEDFVRALDGLFRAKIRSKTSGNFRLDGEALRDVKYCLSIHDEQIKQVSKRELVTAMELVRARINDGNVYTDDGDRVEKIAA